MWHAWFPPKPSPAGPGVPRSDDLEIVPDEEEKGDDK